MKLNITPALFGALWILAPNHLGAEDSKNSLAPTVAAPSDISFSQEFAFENSYTGKSTTKQGSATLGGVDNFNSHFNYVIAPEIKDGVILRFGVDAERNSFGLPPNASLPNTLQSANVIIGADLALNDKIIMRAELHPGIYSDFVQVTGSDFDMPVQIGGTYLWSKDFQIIFGVQIDLKSSYPIIGVPGFRWQFADKWVLSAIPPKPQLQYQFDNNLTLYTGAEILDGTYHVNNGFGANHGHITPAANNLNGQIVDFTEIRIGAGLTWKFTPNMSLDVSGGYMPYREFDFHEDHIGFDQHNTIFHNNIGDGAPYGEIGLSGSF
jgi:hypothetical protein